LSNIFYRQILSSPINTPTLEFVPLGASISGGEREREREREGGRKRKERKRKRVDFLLTVLRLFKA
jgi:hypothetical protein